MYLNNKALTNLFFEIRKANAMQRFKGSPANAAIFLYQTYKVLKPYRFIKRFPRMSGLFYAVLYNYLGLLLAIAKNHKRC